MDTHAKQSPRGKALRALNAAPDGKVYFSYADIHRTICSLHAEIEAFKPDVIVAIGGGGFIPARMLRTILKVPILAVSLELYDDSTNTANEEVKIVQWFDETSGVGQTVRGKRVLIVDEVDDSRATLAACVRTLQTTNEPSAIAVAVVHNKVKPKKGVLADDVLYLAGDFIPDAWVCYPWDAEAYAHSIAEHEALAAQCAGLAGGALGAQASAAPSWAGAAAAAAIAFVAGSALALACTRRSSLKSGIE